MLKMKHLNAGLPTKKPRRTSTDNNLYRFMYLISVAWKLFGNDGEIHKVGLPYSPEIDEIRREVNGSQNNS